MTRTATERDIILRLSNVGVRAVGDPISAAEDALALAQIAMRHVHTRWCNSCGEAVVYAHGMCTDCLSSADDDARDTRESDDYDAKLVRGGLGVWG